MGTLIEILAVLVLFAFFITAMVAVFAISAMLLDDTKIGMAIRDRILRRK